MMWGDDYLPPAPERNPRPDTGSPWVTALLIAAALALILSCVPGAGS